MSNILLDNKNLDDRYYYYYCCAGLGDTMITLSIKKELEEVLKGKIKFILKKTHKIIAKMYDINDFIILNNKEEVKKIEKNLVKKPSKGKIYAAHPCLHPELWSFFEPIHSQSSTIKFLPWIYKFFGVKNIDRVKNPVYYPEITKELEAKCGGRENIKKIVMISPEATSMLPISSYVWDDVVEEAVKNGLIPVSNVIDSSKVVKGSKYIELSSDEAVILGLHCKEVYSVRSGLCDLLFNRGKDLHVYYPSHSGYYLYCLNDMFKRSDIDEQIVLNDF